MVPIAEGMFLLKSCFTAQLECSRTLFKESVS